MQDTTANDDASTDSQTELSASEFGLSDDDIDALLDEIGSGPDIDDLLDDVDDELDADLLDAADDDDIDALLDEIGSGPDIDDLLDAIDADAEPIGELLDHVADDRGDRLADHYSEQVARQWETPEGEWWP